ncbi:hypothetical protein [Mesonia maritima]|uniref:Redoxin domain-containing protein n=1 Tax=Mesonia maritima TaxID=1793873 RepID=A0ABU1K7D3_9FLAO|nr:hypothetical protein [Mesonia maritima]MDR6301514.1 hypothetical protein [Mesonia maritima]
MRYLVIISFFLASCFSITAQETKFKTNIQLIELEELKKEILESEKEYKIAFIFDQFCPASRDIFPDLDELYKNSTQKNFKLFLVTKTKEKNKEELEDHLFYYGYEEPFYILKDKPLFGFLKKTIQGICESCDYKEMGYSDFIVFNENNEVVAQTNYSQTKEEHISILKKYMQ